MNIHTHTNTNTCTRTQSCKDIYVCVCVCLYVYKFAHTLNPHLLSYRVFHIKIRCLPESGVVFCVFMSERSKYLF